MDASVDIAAPVYVIILLDVVVVLMVDSVVEWVVISVDNVFNTVEAVVEIVASSDKVLMTGVVVGVFVLRAGDSTCVDETCMTVVSNTALVVVSNSVVGGKMVFV